MLKFSKFIKTARDPIQLKRRNTAGAGSAEGKLAKPQHLVAIQGYFYLSFIASSGKVAFTLSIGLGFLKTSEIIGLWGSNA